ncbi:MAG: RsmE family RNA methyltransferase [Treponema sp.]|nr:RsmE family RNA methyltransferase [Treponema sp.]
MNICLFTPEEISGPMSKRDERTEHIVKVLHKGAGDTFDAGIIGGAAGTATITKIVPKGEPDEGALYFDFTPASEGKPLYPLTMIIGFPRPIQLRRLLRDVAGLGVCAVHLTGTELGDKSYMKSTVVEKGAAYQMLLDGTAQAASTHVPELFMHATLRECLEAVQGETKIALDNVRPAMSLHSFLYSGEDSLVSQTSATGQPTAGAGQSVVAAIGSERGWTDKERALLEKDGFTRCGMGVRVLRTETAATVAGAIILDAMGKLG